MGACSPPDRRPARGYYLAGLLIEKASGRTYAEYLRDTLFRPLGMRESHYLYNDPIVPNRAEGYRVEDGVLLNDEPLSMLLPFSAGSLGSSVLDLVRWTTALGAGDVVAPGSLKAMTTRRRLRAARRSDTAWACWSARWRVTGRSPTAAASTVS